MKILISFLFTISCLANFTGKWSASGYYKTPKRVGECLEVFMQFEVTKEKFSIIDGGYICGDLQASYPPSSFEIEEGSLYYYGENVGSITDSEINIRYEDGLFHLNLRKAEGQVIFQENWDDGEDYLSISSKMDLLL
ncbi:hypothetical protein [Halobacteriovorax sp.]|uniref:hypothetical protein n=1 Tax=Halobacteriovorax sp. TaxID=2020862 RepID=UPI0035680941